jgi:hypothetical protein
MAMTCESCRIVFFGRPNKKFCSIDCRRAAEMKKRQIKKDKKIEAYKAYMENLPPEWHALPVDPWPEYEPLEWPADDPWHDLICPSVCGRPKTAKRLHRETGGARKVRDARESEVKSTGSESNPAGR